MKRIISVLVVFILLVAFASCSSNQEENNNDQKQNPKQTIEATPTNKPTEAPTATPIPLLKPEKIFYTNRLLYKVYDTGEYGWIGYEYANLPESLINNEQNYIDTTLELEAIQAGIPIIVEYDYHKQEVEKLGGTTILKDEVDMAEYNASYQNQLDELACFW